MALKGLRCLDFSLGVLAPRFHFSLFGFEFFDALRKLLKTALCRLYLLAKPTTFDLSRLDGGLNRVAFFE